MLPKILKRCCEGNRTPIDRGMYAGSTGAWPLAVRHPRRDRPRTKIPGMRHDGATKATVHARAGRQYVHLVMQIRKCEHLVTSSCACAVRGPDAHTTADVRRIGPWQGSPWPGRARHSRYRRRNVGPNSTGDGSRNAGSPWDSAAGNSASRRRNTPTSTSRAPRGFLPPNDTAGSGGDRGRSVAADRAKGLAGGCGGGRAEARASATVEERACQRQSVAT